MGGYGLAAHRPGQRLAAQQPYHRHDLRRRRRPLDGRHRGWRSPLARLSRLGGMGRCAGIALGTDLDYPASDGSNRILVGTDNGPAWVNPQRGVAGRVSFARHWTYGQVDAIGKDRDGSLWAGTLSGAILRIDPKTGATSQTGRVPPRLDYALADSAGRLFITTTTSGIYLREALEREAEASRLPRMPCWVIPAASPPACESPDACSLVPDRQSATA